MAWGMYTCPTCRWMGYENRCEVGTRSVREKGKEERIAYVDLCPACMTELTDDDLDMEVKE